MPSPPSSNLPSGTVTCYKSALDIPQGIFDALKADTMAECRTNVILCHLLKRIDAERSGEAPKPGEFWITCTTHAPRTTQPTLDLILSCSEGPLGKYPVFITSTQPFSHLVETAYIKNRMYKVVGELATLVPHSRVFSVFAPQPLSMLFASMWFQATGIASVQPFYYEATSSLCTRRSFVNHPAPSPIPGFVFDLRLAVPSDLIAVAELCRLFAATSPPFSLTPEKAEREAAILIEKQQLWVHEIKRGTTGYPSIASIVAVTRVSGRVAAITKVFTNPSWRKMGCAERLVRQVTKHLLKTKEAIVLYVGSGNNAAHVYRKVGFQGLEDGGVEWGREGVEPWVEVGFDPRVVDLGHW
ncbi:hypothetical protein JAAARDRAFT_188806 [Jaapia argillacea MUCL 33604]|uniref:N-acetyltransferase domain-containing protein n=1 Tax=Jaapia argillacea MUCL 33604 TaxID=933084 RepID=A0A067Q8A0_9AGAM|nr:hypothetical protein JAAARDRAFT_188806 [Jaapia argillacea MUCL 33604]